jgi:hypothetical protein
MSLAEPPTIFFFFMLVWLVEFCELTFSMLSGRSSLLALPSTYYWEFWEAVGVYYFGLTILAELTLFLKLS